MRKRAFISGFPWWFLTAYLVLCAFFVVVSVETRSLLGLLSVVVMILGVLIYRFCSPQVHLHEGCIKISRYGRKVRIPLEEVAGLEETYGEWPFGRYSAVLHFTTDTRFGRSLYLGSFGNVPSMTLPWGVAELREALNQAAAKRSNHAMQRTANRPCA